MRIVVDLVKHRYKSLVKGIKIDTINGFEGRFVMEKK
jgi:hypothetical protein